MNALTTWPAPESLHDDLPELPSGELPPVWKFDDGVSADLSARWAAVTEDDVLLKDFVRTMTGAGGVLLLLGGLTSVLIGSGHLWFSLCCILLGVGAAVAVRFSHRRDRITPRRVTAREIDLLLAHRSLVGFSDWTHLPADDLPQEVAAARLAAALAGELESLPAWTSEQLAGHRVQLDPAEESRLIQLACREIYDHRQFLDAQLSRATTSPTAVLRATRLEWEERLGQTWTALDDRLSAFGDYVRELREVAALLESSDAGERLHRSLLEHEPAMAVRIVGHEMAREHLQRLRGDVADLQEELAGVQISGDGNRAIQ